MTTNKKQFKLEDDVTYIGAIQPIWVGKIVGIKNGKIQVMWYQRPPDIGWEFDPSELEEYKLTR